MKFNVIAPNIEFSKAEFMDLAAKELYELSAKSWSREQEPVGDPWVKRISGGTHSLLNLTGSLLGSIEMVPQADSIKITGNSIAAYHQFGTSRMEARPVVGLPDEFAEKLAEHFESSITID